MLNIISKSAYNKEDRGPKKVFSNLIKGLNKLNYPYVINNKLDSTNRVWIHDDIDAFKLINSLPDHVKVLAGPNLFMSVEEIPIKTKIKNTVFLEPTDDAKKVWLNMGYDKSPIDIWAAGIDMEKFTPSTEKRESVLVYFKKRDQKDLDVLLKLLDDKKIKHGVIRYGNYNEADYISLLKNTKYIIWVGCDETQGIALQEAMSCDIPILIIDKISEDQNLVVDYTAAHFFDQRCGIKIKGLELASTKIDEMEKNWMDFTPRKFVEENFELKKQAFVMLNLFEKYFGLKVADGYKEKTVSDSKWKTGCFPEKQLLILRDLIKRYRNSIMRFTNI